MIALPLLIDSISLYVLMDAQIGTPLQAIHNNESLMKHILLGGILTALIFSTGCYKTTFVYSGATELNTIEEGRSFMFGGLSGPDKPVRADQMCGGSTPVKVETLRTIGNSCVGSLTLCIYTPQTVRVTCGQGVAHNFYLDSDEQVVAHEIIEGHESAVEDFSSNVF